MRFGQSRFGGARRGHSLGMSVAPLVQSFPAEASQVGPARRAVAAYALRNGIDDAGAVALAVSEALANAVLHAYVGREPGTMEVTARRHGERGLEVVVSDHGGGLTPRPDSPGIGLGLPLVAMLTSRFTIEPQDGGGSRVRMIFG